jgi:hypothetical protein
MTVRLSHPKINAAAPYAAPWIKMMIHAQERPTSGDQERKTPIRVDGLAIQPAYPAGPAAILHRPDPIMIVAMPSFMVELAYVRLPF